VVVLPTLPSDAGNFLAPGKSHGGRQAVQRREVYRRQTTQRGGARISANSLAREFLPRPRPTLRAHRKPQPHDRVRRDAVRGWAKNMFSRT